MQYNNLRFLAALASLDLGALFSNAKLFVRCSLASVYEDVDGCGRGGRRGRFVIILVDILTSCY
jgi:hypothetical protein